MMFKSITRIMFVYIILLRNFPFLVRGENPSNKTEMQKGTKKRSHLTPKTLTDRSKSFVGRVAFLPAAFIPVPIDH